MIPNLQAPSFSMFVLVVLVCVAATPPAVALDPHKTLTQYTYEAWQSRQGLPHSNINSLAQTPDGYLWFGTPIGLIRFDGVRFVSIAPNVTDTHHGIQDLSVGRDGSLWVCTFDSGLSRMKDGKFTTWTEKDGLPGNHIRTVYEDHDGSIWIGLPRKKLSLMRNGKITTYTDEDGKAIIGVRGVAQDKEGCLWFVSDSGTARLKDGRFTFWQAKDGLPHRPYAIFADSAGDIWLSTVRGLLRWKNGKFTSLTTKDGLSSDHVTECYEDRNRNIWVGTADGGLNRISSGKVTSFTIKDGLVHNDVRTIIEDQEGSLWIASSGGGLSRFRDKKYTPYTTKEGLSDDHVRAIYEDREGAIWIGTINGLNRYKDGKFTVYTSRHGLSSSNILSIQEDHQGALWIGTNEGGLNRFKDGKFSVPYKRDGMASNVVNAVCAARDGSLWVGTNGGLYQLKGGSLIVHAESDGNADTRNWVSVIYQGRDQSLWIGTRNDGLKRYRDGAFTAYGRRDGLSNLHISSIHEDDEGVLWISTWGGLNRFKDGRFTTYTAKEGLFEDTLLQILEDEAGNLWMSGDKGFSRVSRKQLNDFAEGKIKQLTPFFFERDDGRGNVINNGYQSYTGWKSGDGKLWFATIKGVIVIDPVNVKINTLIPPVYIEQVIDKKSSQGGFTTTLPPGHGDLEIRYTGLSLLEPERVRFRYKLEGFDEEWIEAGSRREAYYTNLSPGKYRFVVTASNNDRIWNEQGAAISFYLKPHFHQTVWFYLLCLSVVSFLTWRIHRFRVEKMKEKHASVLLERLAERNRIARELHDTLIQGLVGVSAQLKGVKTRLFESPLNADRHLNVATEMIRETLGEARRSVWDLRSHALQSGDLAVAISEVNKNLSISIPVEVCVKGAPRPLSPVIENNLFRIGQEAVTNALKHAGANQISVELSYEPNCVRLCVRDDGGGFDINAQRISSRHFGLQFMQERVTQINGRLVLQSSKGNGTKVVVVVDADRFEDKNNGAASAPRS